MRERPRLKLVHSQPAPRADIAAMLSKAHLANGPEPDAEDPPSWGQIGLAALMVAAFFLFLFALNDGLIPGVSA